MSARPHVSPALVQLRFWVTASCIALATAAAVQMAVFAFVHFTDSRWSEAKPDLANTRVVLPASIEGAASTAPGTLAKPGRALGTGDATLKGLSRMAVLVGIVCAFGLVIFSLMGVAVAAGGAVPGVERAVNAGVWSTVLALLCIPWAQIVHGEALPGVFSTYETITSASENVAAAGGGFAVACRFVLLPIAAIAGALAVAWHFRTGVERGIIVTDMSELDAAIEQEMASIRSKGGSIAGGIRAVGALNRALGDFEDVPPPPLRAAAGAESMTQPPIAPSLLRKPPGPGGKPMSGGPMTGNR